MVLICWLTVLQAANPFPGYSTIKSEHYLYVNEHFIRGLLAPAAHDVQLLPLRHHRPRSQWNWNVAQATPLIASHVKGVTPEIILFILCNVYQLAKVLKRLCEFTTHHKK